MNRIVSSLRRMTFAALCVGATGLPADAQKADTASPNVILIMSDDQGWGDVGFNGHPDLKTPHLDAMAANGITFERFYAASSLCSPTRASVMTGRYPYRTGVLAAHTAGLRRAEVTVADAAKKKGYQTGFFGKWHTGWVKPDEVSSRGHYSPPWHHGFDEVFATTSAMPTWDPNITPEGWTKWGAAAGGPWKGGNAYVHNGEIATENLSGDDSRIIMDRVIPFIEKNQDERFLAAVWFHTPHEPVIAGPEYRAMYKEFDEPRQHFYGAITAMDEQIGRLRDKLRELGIEKNTVVFFCSDNGPADSLTKKGIASAGPFKGHKHDMYEGGLLVPACVEWPGMVKEGQSTQTRFSTVDYFPTVAKLIGFKFGKKEKRPIDGVDFTAMLREGTDQAIERPEGMFFSFRRLFQGIDGKALIDGDYKVLREPNKKARVRLYNIAEDPFEEKDLAETHPEILKEMLAKIDAIEESCQLSHEGNDYRY